MEICIWVYHYYLKLNLQRENNYVHVFITTMKKYSDQSRQEGNTQL